MDTSAVLQTQELLWTRALLSNPRGCAPALLQKKRAAMDLTGRAVLGSRKRFCKNELPSKSELLWKSTAAAAPQCWKKRAAMETRALYQQNELLRNRVICFAPSDLQRKRAAVEKRAGIETRSALEKRAATAPRGVLEKSELL